MAAAPSFAPTFLWCGSLQAPSGIFTSVTAPARSATDRGTVNRISYLCPAQHSTFHTIAFIWGHDDEPKEHGPLSTRRHSLDTGLLDMCAATNPSHALPTDPENNTISTQVDAEHYQLCQETLEDGCPDGSRSRIIIRFIVTCAW